MSIETSHLRPERGTLVLTPGEPGGVGAEITVKAWQALRHDPTCPFALIGDADHVAEMARRGGLPVTIRRIENLAEAQGQFAEGLPVLHRPLPVAAQAGAFVKGTAPWVLSSIQDAVDLCLGGQASAMVTCPIQKEALYSAGFAHQGHTDYLAFLARNRGHEASDIMMLVGGGLRTVPLTIHIALKDVASALSADMIVHQARIVRGALIQYFGIASPRLAITGLNPHAGENGAMGREEINVIIPALTTLKREGISVLGPLPADTAFHPEAREQYDAILCAYHDQALIPVKTLDFHGGVNVTLGLPFIRTSPDHGTALSLAGTGTARADSLIAAITLARSMAGQTGQRGA